MIRAPRDVGLCPHNEIWSEVTASRKRPIMRNCYQGSRRNVVQSPPREKATLDEFSIEAPELSKNTENTNSILIRLMALKFGNV